MALGILKIKKNIQDAKVLPKEKNILFITFTIRLDTELKNEELSFQ